jgi:hypothetical protein
VPARRRVITEGFERIQNSKIELVSNKPNQTETFPISLFFIKLF